MWGGGGGEWGGGNLSKVSLLQSDVLIINELLLSDKVEASKEQRRAARRVLLENWCFTNRDTALS